jgi:hypothetical protein
VSALLAVNASKYCPFHTTHSHAGGALGYNDQPITYRDYANMYYRDFFFHTREKRSTSADGDAGLIMSRPVDCLLDGVSKVSVDRHIG